MEENCSVDIQSLLNRVNELHNQRANVDIRLQQVDGLIHNCDTAIAKLNKKMEMLNNQIQELSTERKRMKDRLAKAQEDLQLQKDHSARLNHALEAIISNLKEADLAAKGEEERQAIQLEEWKTIFQKEQQDLQNLM